MTKENAMSKGRKIGRRAACATVLGIGGGLLVAGDASAAPLARRRTVAPAALANADFYDGAPGGYPLVGAGQGKFKPEAAKEVYLRFLEAAGYPVSERLRKEMWTSDFGVGRFTEVGMAGMFWVNNQKDNYTSLEMFLLPGQMIPEHWHVALPAENVPVKMESWHVRWGSSYTYGEGEPTAKLAVKIPECEEKYVTVRHEKALRLGEVTGLTRPEQKHWQQAGPEGAIVTETSTFHTGAAVRFTDPRIKF
jgi:D-lyxose ketol-isomerase